MIRLIFILLATCALCACFDSTDRLWYCSPEGISRTDNMKIDLAAKRISGTDTVADIAPIRDGQYVGFYRPFPLLLPREPNKEREVSASGYAFTFKSLVSDERDWWLITAYAAPTNLESRLSTTVLYSPSDGVLSINISPVGEGRRFSSNYVPCGDRTLTFDDLQHVTAEQR